METSYLRKTFLFPDDITCRVLTTKISNAKLILMSALFKNKGRFLSYLGYIGLIIFAIWFLTGLYTDYFSHIGVNPPLEP